MNQDHNGEWMLVRVRYLRILIVALMVVALIMSFALMLHALLPGTHFLLVIFRALVCGGFAYFAGPRLIRSVRPWYVQVIKVGEREDVQREMQKFCEEKNANGKEKK